MTLPAAESPLDTAVADVMALYDFLTQEWQDLPRWERQHFRCRLRAILDLELEALPGPAAAVHATIVPRYLAAVKSKLAVAADAAVLERVIADHFDTGTYTPLERA